MSKVLEPRQLGEQAEDILADLEVGLPKPVEEGPEPAPRPEQVIERPVEQKPEVSADKKVSEPERAPKPQAAPAAALSPADLNLDPVLYQRVETILEAGLGDVYQKLSPAQQREFKVKGEATTKRITQLMQQTKIPVQKIFILIISWLKIIPGVNKFFLEQEAKIKADRILDLKNRQD